MPDTFAYREARMPLSGAKARDLYAIHQHVLAETRGDKGISYAPLGVNGNGETVVVLRGDREASGFPKGFPVEVKTMSDGMELFVYARVRIVRQSDEGERMPTGQQAQEKIHRLLQEGGFSVESMDLSESVLGFRHRRLGQYTRLPFWFMSARLTVVDPQKASATMVRGIGRNRGLGFGMLLA